MNPRNKPYQYSAGEFYMLLKLGIWQGGTVQFWGQADIIPEENSFSHPGDLSVRYNTSPFIRKHLDTGVYLLDISYMGRDITRGINTYRLTVAVCRNAMTHPEALYSIQVSNPIPMKDFFAALGKDDMILGRGLRKKSLFNRPGSIQTSLKPVWTKFISRR